MMSFVHLRAHSQYSVLDATPSISDLVKRAKQENMTALALTDHGNLFGVVDFFKACKEAKIKPIIGCELYVAPQSRHNKTKVAGHRPTYNLPLLAASQTGYRHLCKLSSIGYLEGFYYAPRVDVELLQTYREGLICLDGSLGTRLSHEILQGSEESVLAHISQYRDMYGENYYFDLQRHAMIPQQIEEGGFHKEAWLLQKYQDYISRQEKVNEALIKYSRALSIPLVATNDVHMLDNKDWLAHEILLNIQSGETVEVWERDAYGNLKFRQPNPKRETYPTHSCDFKSQDAMQKLFADVPDAIEKTVEIASRCHVDIDFKTKHYPVFLPPHLDKSAVTDKEREVEVEKFLRQLCEEGIAKRYTPERLAKVQEVYPGKDPLQVVRERLDYELSVIIPKGMSDYLLIVWDFINWAKQNRIPMGPGRGSGAGSVVLYLIGITDIEPLRFHLFFERFINPERISYPDIDVDICMNRRSDVINYTLQKYGKDNVAQIITFGTMKAKMAIKDVGRVLNVPLAKVNEIAKLVPEDLNITIDAALEKDPDLKDLYESNEEVKRLLDLARVLEGSIRNTGIHAAGIIISGLPLTDIIPICNAKDSKLPVTQFSMKPVEAIGMLKVDFLGLTTLTAIQMCVDAVEKRTGRKIDWTDLPLDDTAAFATLNQGRTMGVFQLESGGMQDLARQLHLDRFEEIIAVGALYRPGPMSMIPSFINRKHGREVIEYDHPWMKEILAETYGIMVYQEQVMQIASKLANYTLGEGDVLRRAMGKKDADQMAKEREKFRLGALQNGIDEKTSMALFDKIEKFASYGFNKSHAAAYGYLSYVTAYLKANYPGEWMAALMTCASDDLSKVAKFIFEGQSLGIAMLPPDINEAGIAFHATKAGIRFAMGGIKGVGSSVVEAIVSEREAKGPFKDFYDFMKRIDTKKVGKKAIESLVFAGCFDSFGWSRDALALSIESMFDAVSKEQKEKALGTLSLFSLLGEDTGARFRSSPPVLRPTPKRELLQKEKALLGFFLTGHPMDDYKPILQRLSCVALRRLGDMEHDTVFRTAFIVEEVQTRISSKTQKKFAILIISDGIERRELPIWSELFEEKQHLLLENQLLYAILQVDKRSEELRLSCRWLGDLTAADESMIDECDRAFDKFKHQAQRFAKTGPAKQAPAQAEKKKPEGTPSMKALSIRLNAATARHSHILHLKKILEQQTTLPPIEIDFHLGEKAIATLHLSPRGAGAGAGSLDASCKQGLLALGCVLAVE